jgi:hypothetical protein
MDLAEGGGGGPFGVLGSKTAVKVAPWGGGGGREHPLPEPGAPGVVILLVGDEGGGWDQMDCISLFGASFTLSQWSSIHTFARRMNCTLVSSLSLSCLALTFTGCMKGSGGSGGSGGRGRLGGGSGPMSLNGGRDSLHRSSGMGESSWSPVPSAAGGKEGGSSANDQTISQQTTVELTDFRSCVLGETIVVHVIITLAFEDAEAVRECRALAARRMLSLVGFVLVCLRLPFRHFLDRGERGISGGFPLCPL